MPVVVAAAGRVWGRCHLVQVSGEEEAQAVAEVQERRLVLVERRRDRSQEKAAAERGPVLEMHLAVPRERTGEEVLRRRDTYTHITTRTSAWGIRCTRLRPTEVRKGVGTIGVTQ